MIVAASSGINFTSLPVNFTSSADAASSLAVSAPIICASAGPRTP